MATKGRKEPTLKSLLKKALDEDLQTALAMSRSLTEAEKRSRRAAKASALDAPPLNLMLGKEKLDEVISQRLGNLLFAEAGAAGLSDKLFTSPGSQRALSERSLWRLASGGDDASFYLDALQPPLVPSSVRQGDRMVALSQIPGRDRTCVLLESGQDLSSEFVVASADCAEEDPPFPAEEAAGCDDSPRPGADLRADLLAMVGCPRGADVSVLLDDGRRIPAHRFMLAARCPDLLGEVDSEDRLVATGVSGEAATSFLNFVYAEEVRGTDVVLAEVESLLERWRLAALAEAFRRRLADGRQTRPPSVAGLDSPTRSHDWSSPHVDPDSFATVQTAVHAIGVTTDHRAPDPVAMATLQTPTANSLAMATLQTPSPDPVAMTAFQTPSPDPVAMATFQTLSPNAVDMTTLQTPPDPIAMATQQTPSSDPVAIATFQTPSPYAVAMATFQPLSPNAVDMTTLQTPPSDPVAIATSQTPSPDTMAMGTFQSPSSDPVAMATQKTSSPDPVPKAKQPAGRRAVQSPSLFDSSDDSSSPLSKRIRVAGSPRPQRTRVPETAGIRLEEVETPLLKRELAYYGVRQLPKRKAVQVLSEIMRVTHPGAVRASPPGGGRAASPVPTAEKRPAAARAKRTKAVCSEAQLRDFFMARRDLYQRVLRFEILELSAVRALLKEEGLRVSVDDLMRFLDAQGVTFVNRGKDEGGG